jgi:hypothetical protein
MVAAKSARVTESGMVEVANGTLVYVAEYVVANKWITVTSGTAEIGTHCTSEGQGVARSLARILLGEMITKQRPGLQQK